MVGKVVGGAEVGDREGTAKMGEAEEGATVLVVGTAVGDRVAVIVATTIGLAVGTGVVGTIVGTAVGDRVGVIVGTATGLAVGAVRAIIGTATVGEAVGIATVVGNTMPAPA
jgi:hypothetical protein